MEGSPVIVRKVPAISHFSLEMPAPVERQSLTLNQYPVYIDLICDYLYIHMRLDTLADQKYALKQKLRLADIATEIETKLKKSYEYLSAEVKQANDKLVKIRSSLREDFPKANLSAPIEIEVPLNCSEAQLRKDFQREPFVVCGIRFGPSSSSDWGYEFIKLCTTSAVAKEMNLSGTILELMVRKTLCAASRTDIGGQAYVQLLEFDHAQAAVSGEDCSDAAIISKGNTPPTCIDIDAEKVTVTVISHLYKTDPSVLSVYNPDRMASVEAKKAESTSLFGERDRSGAVAQDGNEGSGSCCVHGLKEPKSDWLTHFQKFMPVMTRTVLKVGRNCVCDRAKNGEQHDHHLQQQRDCGCERTVCATTVLVFSTVSNIKLGTPVFRSVDEKKTNAPAAGLWSHLFTFS